jgi:parallel beta-helix repeat protein
VHDDTKDVITFRGVSGGGIDGLDITASRSRYGSGMLIDGSTGVRVQRSRIHDGRTFGLVVVRSKRVLVIGNDVYGNADGIEERYASNLTIRANRIHGNLAEVDAGRGREGINFYKSTGRVTVESNTLWDNGTHFEVYGASGLVFRDNVMHDGQVMETGTDGLPCADNVFMRNIAYCGRDRLQPRGPRRFGRLTRGVRRFRRGARQRRHPGRVHSLDRLQPARPGRTRTLRRPVTPRLPADLRVSRGRSGRGRGGRALRWDRTGPGTLRAALSGARLPHSGCFFRVTNPVNAADCSPIVRI